MVSVSEVTERPQYADKETDGSKTREGDKGRRLPELVKETSHRREDLRNHQQNPADTPGCEGNNGHWLPEA